MVTIYDLFRCTAESFPEKLSFITEDAQYTFRDISAKINRLANGLYKRGVRPGMTVGLLMKNSVDFFCLFYAVNKLGAALMMLNWRLTLENTIEHINLSRCETLIYDEDWSEQLASVKSEIPGVKLYVSTDASGDTNIDSLYAVGDPEWDFDSGVGPDDPALYLLTGGTSSNSKAAIASQENMVMRVLLPRLYNTLDYSPEDNFLIFNPMFHQGGVGIYLPVSVAGGCLTMLRKMDVEKVLQAVEKYRVTRLLLLPPSLCNRIKESPELQGYDLSSVKIVMLSGGASSGKLAQDVFDIFPNARISTSYGATENAAETMHVYSREEYRANPHIAESVGRRSPFSHLRLVDEQGRDVPVNTPGECLGKSYGMLRGYIGRPSPFVDGYFPTGDYLACDENGLYYFKDRKNFVIKSGGELVIPSEVEAALQLHEAVAKAAVFGMPDSDLGEMVTAAVVLEAGCTVEEEELQQFTKEHIASYKKPKKIYFVDDLCYTTVGKVDKRALQKLCAEIEEKR